MRNPLAFLAGIVTIPALVVGMNLTGGGGHADNRVEYERLSFEMPEGWEFDRERALRTNLPGGGVFQFTPENLASRLNVPGRPESDRRIEVGGQGARDIRLVRANQYTRVVVLDEGGVFSVSVLLEQRAEADRALDEILRTVDIH